MDRHGGLAGENARYTQGRNQSHPRRGPYPERYGLGAPQASCQAICTLTGADCHSTGAGTIVERCLRVLQSGPCVQAALAGGDSYLPAHWGVMCIYIWIFITPTCTSTRGQDCTGTRLGPQFAPGVGDAGQIRGHEPGLRDPPTSRASIINSPGNPLQRRGPQLES